MSANSDRVKKWRHTAKRRMVEAMGGSCQVCGYNKCIWALEFHHIDRSKKKFGLGEVRANPTNWDSICNELEKCILVCSNCHREITSEFISAPDIYSSFNNEFRNLQVSPIVVCSACGVEFTPHNKMSKTCSILCKSIKSRKVFRPDYDTLLNELKSMSYCEVGRKYNVSDNAIRKWIKFYEKYKIIQT